MSALPPMSEFPPNGRPASSSRKADGDGCCSRTERCCCAIATWLPIAVVYGATFWAVYVNVYLVSVSFISGFLGMSQYITYTGWFLAILSMTLYALCIWSYSAAVFKDPGSPIEAVSFSPTVLTQDNGYSYLPSWQPNTNPALQANLTVKHDGRARYCQKCNYMKPDRTHHCSICRRCILKMDHHCPWLGNCIGFANYKAFVLFLLYLTLFCFECCVQCGVTLWYWITYVTPVSPCTFTNKNADYLPVQWILLAAIAGIVALCVGGFSIWHIMHVLTNITTIEALEKTRYVHRFPSHAPRRRSSNDATNIFDIGRRKNWEQVMGDKPLKWFLPILNSQGDGLAFPVSEDVRGILRGMRNDLAWGDNQAVEDDDDREYRRDENGRWMMHD